MNSQLTPLKETGIYIVELEMEKFEVDMGLGDECIEYAEKPKPYLIPEGFVELGTIKPDIISFDPAPYLERRKDFDTYKNYDVEILDCETADSSFRSLLASCGYYWVNPMRYPNMGDYIVEGIPYEIGFKEDLNRWQSFEDTLVTGILLSLIKT